MEAWAQRVALMSFVAFAAALPIHRDPRRAADAFVAGVPKGRLGREGFATRFGRVLADRGVLPLDASSLRRLDRVDAVVVDRATLLTGRSELDDVVSLGAVEADRAWTLGERLFDPDDVMATRRDDGWTLAPLDAEAATVPRGGKARGKELRANGGVPLGLSRNGTVEALLSASAELDPGLRPRRRGAPGRAPARRRRPQRAGGQAHRGRRPSWGADLLCGRELAEAALLIHASAVARQVSCRSARLAAIGSAGGTAAAMTGPRWGAGRRALLAVNAAAGLTLLSGMWSGAGLSTALVGDEPGAQSSSAVARSARDSMK